MAGPIAAMAMEVMRAQMQQDPEQYRQESVRVEREANPVTPERLHTFGGLADAASTYYFAKKGTAKEANPMLSGIKSPEALGLAAVGGLAATKGLAALIRKKYPKVAQALSANLGAEQTMLAAQNFRLPEPVGSFDKYKMSMDRHRIKK